MRNECKIYGLYDPITGDIRYVGKTALRLSARRSGHVKDKQNTYKTWWIRSLLKKGLKPEIRVIEICAEENWVERENYWISYYKEAGFRITNQVEGGGGMKVGYKHTPATIEKIREAAKKQNKGKFKKGRIRPASEMEKCQKKVLQYDLQGNFIRKWESIRAASGGIGIFTSNISSCLRNICKQAGGFQWKYYEEEFLLKIDEYNTKVKSSSGVRGISFVKSRSKWAVYTKVEGKTKYIGEFFTIKEAKIKKQNYENNLHR